MNLQADAVKAYEAAVFRASLLQAEWERLGQPLLAHGSTGQEVPHPLLRAINTAELVADRLRRRLLPAHRGPEPKAVVRPSPAAKLRAR
jgi:hypothetical protein